MNGIPLELLNKDHLARYQDIDVMDAEGFGKLVWDSRRQVPFVSVDHEGSLMEHGVIRVPSLATSDLAPVYAKLAEIDSGDHRLVR